MEGAAMAPITVSAMMAVRSIGFPKKVVDRSPFVAAARNGVQRCPLRRRRSPVRARLPQFARIMRGVELAGAGLAGERDQVLGDDPGGDDLLDAAFPEARPRIAPEGPAIVGPHSELPADFGQHGETALEVPDRELAGPRRPFAPMRIGAV